MNLVDTLKTSISNTVGVADVQEVINSGGVVFAYPRKKQVSLNGGKAKPATDAAIILANHWAKAQLNKESK